MSEMQRFDNRIAIVTGAGRGIGREHAVLLAERGAKVVVNDMGGTAVDGSGQPSQEPALVVVSEILKSGGTAIANFDDISTVSGANNLISKTLESYGKLDILVNNAGIQGSISFAELDYDYFDRMMKTHAYGSFNVTHAAWPHMIEQSYGRIVMTTSGAALYGLHQSAHYCIAKGAIIGMTRALALEGEPHGIKVNAIAPAAYTRMVHGMEDEDLRKHMEELMPPHLVAPMAVWLAHDKCNFSGQIFDVGAGRVARVFIAESPGYCDRKLSPESIGVHINEICNEENYLVFKDGPESAVKMSEMATALMERNS